MHVITGLTPGGAELTLLRLLSSMDRQQFEPLVVSLMDENTVGTAIKALGIPVQALGFPAGRPNLRGLLKFIRLLRKFRPQLIHGRMYHANLLALLGGWIARCPVVFGIHHALDDLAGEKRSTRLAIRLNARFSPWATRTLFISPAVAEQHCALGFPRNRAEIISNGVDCERFFPDASSRGPFRAELGIADDTVLVGMAGRYHAVKDHDSLLRALSAVTQRHGDVQLLLCGAGVDKGNATLAATIRTLGLEGRVHLLGHRQDMERIFRSLDIFVSASKSEAFGNVLAEAMASSLPCIATEVGASAHVLGDAGVLVPPRNPEALAQAIEGLIRLSSEQRASLGARARERVIAHFAFRSMVARHEELYGSLAGHDQEPAKHAHPAEGQSPGQTAYPRASESGAEV